MPTESYRYQGWELRPDERLLTVKGVPSSLKGRAFDLLVALARRGGQVVTKAELLDAVWASLVVAENNLTVQIATLRRVLGPKVIQTVSRIGYRLDAVPESAAPPLLSPRPAPPQQPRADVDEPEAGPSSVALEDLSDLVGREPDVRRLLEDLRQARLVSLVGTGGVGKTSLAREVMRSCATRSDPAGYWVDLAPTREVRQVVSVLSKCLGIETQVAGDPLDEVAVALVQRAAWIVLDNCEHVLDEVARIVRRLLEVAPEVRWLITSQVPLHLAGEVVYRLDPLAVPPTGCSPAKALEFGAVALLCQRIREVDRRFRLDDSNVDAAVLLCRQLDGLPLAIEMAAPRVANFGLDEVRLRLGQRLQFLSRPKVAAHRHSTLQATFNWSYGLLTDFEKIVFQRLEPFLGGFRPDLAKLALCNAGEVGGLDEGEVLNALAGLVDKSLVQCCVDVPGRLQLLESARDYALVRLEAAGETAEARIRHMEAVARWFASAPSDAAGMTDAQWIRRYAAEAHNAHAALACAIRENRPDEMAQLVVAVAMIDSFLCRQAEILQSEIPREMLERARPEWRAAAFVELSWAHYLDGDRALGAWMAARAFDLFTDLEMPASAYRALAQLTRLFEAQPGMGAQAQEAWSVLENADCSQVSARAWLFCGISCGLLHRPGFTAQHMRELGETAADAGYDAIAAVCAGNVTDKLLIAGQDEQAVETARAMLPTKHQPRARAIVLNNTALALVRLGRIVEAYETARQAFEAMPSVAHFLVDTFALAAARQDCLRDAAVLQGCASRKREERNEQPDLSEALSIQETRRILQAGMDEQQCLALGRFGATMKPAEALIVMVFARQRRGPARGGSATGAPSPMS